MERAGVGSGWGQSVVARHLPPEKRGRARDSDAQGEYLALMLKHIWKLFSDKESLWCKWVHAVFLSRKNFWISPTPTYCSWAWKRLLHHRGMYQQHFRWKIGNGKAVSFWFDPWHLNGPLNLLFSNQQIYRSGIPRTASVADAFSSPLGWYVINIMADWWDPLPQLTQLEDCFQWIRHPSGRFSSASAYDLFRPKGNVVPWSSFVWSTAMPPRYQTHLWLMARNRLPTQVMLLSWAAIPAASCPFCSSRPDSVDHLFFACRVLGNLVSYWAAKFNVSWRNKSWRENLDWASNRFSGGGFYQSLARFSYGALCYIIWKERNNMIFRNQALFIPVMKMHLCKAVKDKAMTFKYVVDIPKNRRLQRSWDLSPSIFL